MKTSIIIPVYNEEKTVEEIIKRVKKLKIKKEIIVVDDGSTDNSYKIIKKIKGIKIIRNKPNMGKGAAIRYALEQVTGDIVLIQDADLELNPEEIPKIIQPIITGKAKVVYGSRNLYKEQRKFTLFYLGGTFITFMTNLLYDTNLSDEPCGFKCFQTKVIKSINIANNGFEFEPEITAKLSKKGIKIYEVPVHATARTKEQGKKLGYLDGFKALWVLIKYKFFVTN